MCNLYTHDATLIELMESFRKFLGMHLVLEAGAQTLSNRPLKDYVAPKVDGLFVRPVDARNPGGGLEPAIGRWGIVPWMHKGPVNDWKSSTNNCRSEEMAAKPAFRDALKEKRCIIPATYFVEHTGPRGSMTKHMVSMADGSPLFLAGLWSRHAWEGEATESYTMLMQDVREEDDMRPFHNRQPVVLDRVSAPIWLDLGADWSALLKSPPRGTLAFDPPTPVPA